ncbi:hypothetical protein VTL71DRAFT_7972 [Oculimacula yallundae]|uniref:Ubiquitin 3 binding protein But2 C-terminal domain-containing protein n=1 Tax=Oculimacula yallundae TaxID=86028 RepID=A0ABR4CYQ5_9HELO
MKSMISALVLSLLTTCTSATSLELLSSRTLKSIGIPGLDSKCPVNGTLSGEYLNPTLIVPVSKKAPNVAFGSTKVPIITPGDFCTIFNLMIPPTAVGKTCTLEFLFPEMLTSTAPYVYSGGGHFTFTGYAFGTGATEETTFNKQPPPGPSPPQPPAVLSPGNAYTINIGGCAIEKGMAGMEVSGMLCSTDTALAFLQSDQKCPMGFFVAIS